MKNPHLQLLHLCRVVSLLKLHFPPQVLQNLPLLHLQGISEKKNHVALIVQKSNEAEIRGLSWSLHNRQTLLLVYSL